MDVPLELVGIEYLFLPGSVLSWVALGALTVTAGECLRRELGKPSAIVVSAGVLLAYIVMGNMSLAVALAAASVGALVWRRAGHRLVERSSRGAAGEILLVLGGYALYELARVHLESSYLAARGNALKVVDIEKELGLFFEADLQSLFLSWRPLVELATNYYQFGFLASVTAVVLWLFLADDDNYRLMRNSLGISCLLGVLAISLFPAAPPRLMAEFNIVDTTSLIGRQALFANEYASVPSLHVGWMALAGYCVGRSIGGTRGQLLKFLPGITMAITVIVTGNHWWLDAVIGTAFALGPALVAVHLTSETGGSLDEVAPPLPAS